MKTIILISSIFYILGLTISNKIDLIKPHSKAVEKVIITKADNTKKESTIDFKDAKALKPDKDSVQESGITSYIPEAK